jgi:hypothetical protein
MAREARSDWISRIHERHRKDLTFQELRKGVVALSRIYVENRPGIESGAVFDGKAKRAAFACYYSPLHFLVVREVVLALEAHELPLKAIVDLGCGLGVAGAAWATVSKGSPRIVGYDRNRWAADEARKVLRELGVPARILPTTLEKAPVAGRNDAVVAAFSVNELDSESRSLLLPRLIDGARRGAAILVVEPIARKPNPWWDGWRDAFQGAGGRSDSWRFPIELPESLAALDRASGLDHKVLTARTLYLPPSPYGLRRGSPKRSEGGPPTH